MGLRIRMAGWSAGVSFDACRHGVGEGSGRLPIIRFERRSPLTPSRPQGGLGPELHGRTPNGASPYAQMPIVGGPPP